ncbi:MAG: hypothetical protein COA78_15450 [Blastopirellula sp.]|nr:MAG: hypothetical protein COA78_15450 [Blastopirellula sp.]
MANLHSVNSAMKTQSSSQCKNHLLVVLLCVLLVIGIVVAYLLCLGGRCLIDTRGEGHILIPILQKPGNMVGQLLFVNATCLMNNPIASSFGGAMVLWL